jgi:hypothetical protein
MATLCGLPFLVPTALVNDQVLDNDKVLDNNKLPEASFTKFISSLDVNVPKGLIKTILVYSFLTHFLYIELMVRLETHRLHLWPLVCRC